MGLPERKKEIFYFGCGRRGHPSPVRVHPPVVRRGRPDGRPFSTSTPVTKICGRSLARFLAACEGRLDATRRRKVGRTPIRDGIVTACATCEGGTRCVRVTTCAAKAPPSAYACVRTYRKKPNDVKKRNESRPSAMDTSGPPSKTNAAKRDRSRESQNNANRRNFERK